MKRSYLFALSVLLISVTAMLCGCSGNGYDEGRNEQVSFIAAISGRTQTRAVIDTSKTNRGNLIVSSAELQNGITKSVSKMTRATVDGNWGTGGYIAVQEGGTTKQYTVDSNGNITSSSPFYWESKANISVTSWYPYSASMPPSWTVNSNQSTAANYGGSDFLYASNTFTYSGGSSNKLQYTHETAKVVINIVKANDVTSASNISFVTIGTSGTPIDLSGTIGSTGAISATGTATGYITPYQTTSSTYAATYSALVIPQDMNGKQFIAIKVVGGNTFYYKPSTSTSLSGGYVYTYNVTVPSSTTNVGDYYFSDGSWGTLAVHANSTVWPIGVIFSNSPSTKDQSYGWKHGYAMALTYASTGCVWGPTGTDESELINYNVTYTTVIANKDGYTETHAVKDAHSSTLQSNYPAFYYALNYGTSEVGGTLYTAPNVSSGWYLPSVGQWYDILINLGGLSTVPSSLANNNSTMCWGPSITKTCVDKINTYLSVLSNYGYTINPFYYNTTGSSTDYEDYWSSTEYDGDEARNTFFNDTSFSDFLGLDGNVKTDMWKVRSVIAF
jgi:hypothetical protein